MNKFIKTKRPQLDIEDWIVLEGYRGSISHGTYVPTGDSAIDDKDIIGVAIPPIEYYFGLKKFEQKELKINEWDILIYDIRKYFKLLVNSNPNVLCLLWLEKCYYTKITPIGQLLLDNRDLFISINCYNSFCGYARGQMKKMVRIGEYSYRQGYLGAKRKRLVDKFGFDVKHGSHLLRLLRMGIELLKTGKINVLRPDNNYLIDIKQGKYSLEHINKEADRLFPLMEEAFVHSNLPIALDFEKINNLLVKCIEMKYNYAAVVQ